MSSPFNIISEEAMSVEDTTNNKNLDTQIKELIGSSEVFVFMKGTPELPQCGFSANTVGMLTQLGVDFKSFNVLSDFDLREAVKDFSDWPTYPQVFYKGKLLGGNDIMTEMFHSGELEQILQA